VTRASDRIERFLRRPWAFAAVLLVVFLIADVIAQPALLRPVFLGRTLTLVAPLVLAAVASTPSILSGGIDISIGPLMGLINVIAIIGLGMPFLNEPVPMAIAFVVIGALVGAINGVLVAVVRLQPVVATIGTYLVLAGVNVRLLPVPKGPAPAWISTFSGSIGPIPGAVVLMAVPVVAWLLIRRTPYYKALYAVGGDEVASYSAGINTIRVKLLAYTLGGAFAGIGGIALTALLSSADAGIGPTYTVVAIAAVALGGTSLAGGRGGLIGAFIGAADIFLIQNLLTAKGLSSLWLPLLYGSILIVSLVIGVLVVRRSGAGVRT
jgi:ribose transport system permease protein